ncbi:hypothetical protein PE067_06340 [Paracoccus sp. DMF-8]|uniref:hypothetical protein n=1 Tax=Paracoccus sp. DMF-8 TaxID=3019445 RepID=UPI0023E897BF|nr:hypothetical protein [Paracoccus sp. DMF-8]MDF3605797.1 hypothetical protein [Paracoccus sp. DMF-8]
MLCGPAGLLSGSGEPGAAVSMTRKRANATKPEGSLELRYGSWSNIGGTVDLGTPLSADGNPRGRFIMDVASSILLSTVTTSTARPITAPSTPI